jgi:hypothetical protein
MRRRANQRNPKGASKSAERPISSSHLLAKGLLTMRFRAERLAGIAAFEGAFSSAK